MPQPQLLCRVCGHPKGSHGQPRQVPLSLEFIQGYQKAVSDCPGYDSGDSDVELAQQQDRAVQDETAILDELRPGSHLGQHYD